MFNVDIHNINVKINRGMYLFIEIFLKKQNILDFDLSIIIKISTKVGEIKNIFVFYTQK